MIALVDAMLLMHALQSEVIAVLDDCQSVLQEVVKAYEARVQALQVWPRLSGV